MSEEQVKKRRRHRRKRTFAEKHLTRRNLLIGGAAAALTLGGGGALVAARLGRSEVPEARPVRLSLVPAEADDAHAGDPRLPPPRFPALPFDIVAVHGPGDVTISQSLLSAFHAAHPDVARGKTAHVSVSGNDASGAPGQADRPFRTTTAALASEATIVVLEDGPHLPPQYVRLPDKAPVAKLVLARNPGRARFEMPGDDLSAAAWVQDGALWRTTLEHPGIGGALVHRVTRDDRKDRDGFPARLRKRASLAGLRAAGDGWFVDPDARALYIAAERPIPELKARLKAYYFDTERNARVHCQETVLCVHGVDLHGVTVWALHQEEGVPHPAVWLSHFTSLFSPSYGAHASDGGDILMETGRIHAPARDGFNADYGDGGGLIVAAGVHTTETGDVEGLGPPESRNIQAGSSHSGAVAVFGCVAERSAGQHYADTSTAAAPNVSWYVGNEVRGGEVAFHSVGTGGESRDNRLMFLDTNRSLGCRRSAVIEARGEVRLFNNRFDVAARSVDDSFGIRPYAPDNPLAAAQPTREV